MSRTTHSDAPRLLSVLGFAALAVAGGPASANSIANDVCAVACGQVVHSFELRDLATFTSSTSHEPLTFAGSGFAGMLNEVWSGAGPIWTHAFTVEPEHAARTLMQVDLGSLSGQRVVSAMLSFMLLDGQEAPGTSQVRLSGFDAGEGQMQLRWDAPSDSFGHVLGSVEGSLTDHQSIDVTPLVAYSVAQGQRWLGLHLQSMSEHYLYTATHDYPDLLSPDKAQVRLQVMTTPVPEPSTWALLACGLGVVGWARRRKQSRTAT